jgi:hypothetical protein
MRTGFYSLIQYVSDGERAEGSGHRAENLRPTRLPSQLASCVGEN